MTNDQRSKGQEADDAGLLFLGSDVTNGEEWVTFFGGRLEQPVSVKYQIDQGGRLRITAVKIDNDRPVSSATLRTPPLGAMERLLSNFIRESQQMAAEARTSVEERLASTGDPIAVEDLQRFLTKVEVFESRLADALDAATADGEPDRTPFRSRGRGARPPDETDYMRFAQLYLEQLRRQPRGAVTATADAAGMDRSTVYRWLKACRSPERNYLPAELEDR